MGTKRARQIIASATALGAGGSALVELILILGIFFTAIALARERLGFWHGRLAELEKQRWNGEVL
jgi:hypothetical protein